MMGLPPLLKVTMNKCKFIKPDKKRCEAFALKEGQFCYFHSQDMAEERQDSVKRGGDSPKRSYVVDDEIKLDTPDKVRELMEKTIRNMNQNKISVNMANATGYLANISLKAIEQGDMERRIATLEYAYKIKIQAK